ncbi:potassium-transporting ATPase subunit KdpA [Acidithiobacillus sp. IBUN Pt1247-S3]|uniref:potassium-transporting ATPase subunit KdpA n=1 Tax=Acidithiobacillus sp. IBUN Pt1247-S3 TaxID=3166642 RepID=UPI0034E4367E
MMNATLLTAAVFLVTIALAWPIGAYMERVYSGQRFWATRFFGGLERSLYWLSGIQPEKEMSWKRYALLWLLFNLIGGLVLYFLLYFQNYLPLNPQGLPSPGAGVSFNTAAAFVTNTDWQDYSGETTMSYLSQVLGLGVQFFFSAASGMVLAVALTRGFSRTESKGIGNLWVDLTRSVLYILLPLASVLALYLVSQGAIQNFAAYLNVHLLDPFLQSGKLITTQTLAMGPAGSQTAIEMLGNNGGGFFNANCGQPFQSPTGMTNFVLMVAMILLPFSLIFYFGRAIGSRKMGWALMAVALLLLVPLALFSQQQDLVGNPVFSQMGISQAHSAALAGGGNMVGVEDRIGTAGSALFGALATGTSTGSSNSAYDSFMPMSGFVNLFLMQLAEVAPGGVGSGVASEVGFFIIAVFLGGLMVGRTPEFFGKKLEAYEMKMASLAILIMPILILMGTAIAVCLPGGREAILNPGPHGFSEILYAMTSPANNNGSSFGGLNADTVFYNVLTGILILMNRYLTYFPLLAIAGALAAKRRTAASVGTLNPTTPVFVVFSTGVILLVGALNFIPALALGPVAEALSLPTLHLHP